MNHAFRDLLCARGLSQVAAAELCGVSAQTIWRIVHGKHPRMCTRRQILATLGIELDRHVEIFGELPKCGLGVELGLDADGFRTRRCAILKSKRAARILEGLCEDCGAGRDASGSATRCAVCRQEHNVIARDYQRRVTAERRAS